MSYGAFRDGARKRWLLASALALSVVATACVPGYDGELSADGGSDTESAAPTLAVVDAASEVFCDNSERAIGEVRGADPGEKITLSSPRPIQLTAEQVAATADEDGAYSLTWSCGPTEAGQPWELNVKGEESGRKATVSFVGTATDPDGPVALRITLGEDPFVCDGQSRDLGELTDAAPLEPVTFDTEGANNLVDGVADANGRLPLTWQCSPYEAGPWEVTALGLESNRVGQFTIVGVAPPPEEVPKPTVRIDEDPFVCDGDSRVFANLTDFLPGENVNFWAPDTANLKDGQADDSGALSIRWACQPADAGRVWEVTATGTQSGRTVSFKILGGEAPPGPSPTVAPAEDPFRCDGATRPFATISGFVSNELIDFTSPQTESIRQGQADENGDVMVRWTCDTADVGRVWEVTATGATSLRSVSFQITGTAP